MQNNFFYLIHKFWKFHWDQACMASATASKTLGGQTQNLRNIIDLVSKVSENLLNTLYIAMETWTYRNEGWNSDLDGNHIGHNNASGLTWHKRWTKKRDCQNSDWDEFLFGWVSKHNVPIKLTNDNYLITITHNLIQPWPFKFHSAPLLFCRTILYMIEYSSWFHFNFENQNLPCLVGKV